MISCPDEFKWSPSKAARRQSEVEKVLGKKVVARIVGFALFLLGADRKEAAGHVGISLNTFFSFLTRMNDTGIDGLRDRRKKSEPATPRAVETVVIEAKRREHGASLSFGKGDQAISLSDECGDQKKILLLTFLANGLLPARDVAELLGYTESYARSLARSLSEGDVNAVLDQRKGQLGDYRVTPEMKGELITQWAVRAMSGTSTSSPALSEALQGRCEVLIPARTVRHHLKKLGITHLGNKVKSLAEGVKKGS